jgi:hypothetical protein
MEICGFITSKKTNRARSFVASAALSLALIRTVSTHANAAEISISTERTNSYDPTARELTINGDGFIPKTELKFTLNGTNLHQITSDSNGEFKLERKYSTTQVLNGDKLEFTVSDGKKSATSTYVVNEDNVIQPSIWEKIQRKQWIIDTIPIAILTACYSIGLKVWRERRKLKQ